MLPTAALRRAKPFARFVSVSFVLSCLIALSSVLIAGQAQAFSLDDVTARARDLMDKPYAAPVSNLPPVFSNMQFADYQKMQPLIDKFEWRDKGTPFKLSFYHQGMQFNAPVKISEIVGSEVQEIKYDASRFDFGDLKFDKDATAKLGYAGFRVMYPINQDGKDDEIMSFLGASYFRVVGKSQVYGLSSRGLAIDTALPAPEEFPNFREFWIQRPNPQDKQLVIYALLDSPRATGAYQFILTPGKDAVLDVQANLFMRGDVNTLGIAPLTSMFLYGPNQQSEKRNFRPDRAAEQVGQGQGRAGRDPDARRDQRQHRRLLDARRATEKRSGDAIRLPHALDHRRSCPARPGQRLGTADIQHGRRIDAAQPDPQARWQHGVADRLRRAAAVEAAGRCRGHGAGQCR